METSKPVHPRAPPELCLSFPETDVHCVHTHTQTLKPAALCFSATGMLQRRPTIEEFVDALVSELNPNFETFIMDSESWKMPLASWKRTWNLYKVDAGPRGGQTRQRGARSFLLSIFTWSVNELFLHFISCWSLLKSHWLTNKRWNLLIMSKYWLMQIMVNCVTFTDTFTMLWTSLCHH